VRQPITDLGATAFETLYSMIIDAGRARHDVILPTRLIRRESCGCPPQSLPGVTLRRPAEALGPPAARPQETTAPAQRQA
jgi:LacI family transcriptional regulator